MLYLYEAGSAVKKSADSIKQIETVGDFNSIRNGNHGYIVITDIAGPNKVHRLTCRYISVRNFRKKVIDNACKNGQYYWASNMQSGKNDLGAVECFICLR